MIYMTPNNDPYMLVVRMNYGGKPEEFWIVGSHGTVQIMAYSLESYDNPRDELHRRACTAAEVTNGTEPHPFWPDVLKGVLRASDIDAKYSSYIADPHTIIRAAQLETRIANLEQQILNSSSLKERIERVMQSMVLTEVDLAVERKYPPPSEIVKQVYEVLKTAEGSPIRRIRARKKAGNGTSEARK